VVDPRFLENHWRNPGVGSAFSLSLGTVHECNTSAAVTIIRIGEFIGSTTRLSVSNSRNVSILLILLLHYVLVKLKFCEV
jgi:hypothetical protein